MKHEPNRGDDHEEHAEKRMNLERAVPEHDIKDHRKTHLRQSDDRDPRPVLLRRTRVRSSCPSVAKIPTPSK